MRAVLDTNIIPYLLANRLAEPLPEGEYYAPIISYVEALSFPSLDARADEQVREAIQAYLEVKTSD